MAPCHKGFILITSHLGMSVFYRSCVKLKSVPYNESAFYTLQNKCNVKCLLKGPLLGCFSIDRVGETSMKPLPLQFCYIITIDYHSDYYYHYTTTFITVEYIVSIICYCMRHGKRTYSLNHESILLMNQISKHIDFRKSVNTEKISNVIHLCVIVQCFRGSELSCWKAGLHLVLCYLH